MQIYSNSTDQPGEKTIQLLDGKCSVAKRFRSTSSQALSSGSEDWAPKEENRRNWKLFTTVVSGDMRLDHVGYHRGTKRLEELLETHPQWKCEDTDGSPNSAQWKSQDLRGECLVHGWCSTPRPIGRPQQTIRHAFVSTLKKLGFEEEEGEEEEKGN
jgi:hypothetical protein